MQRRKFITIVGGAATWPSVVRAQQAGKVDRIGFLGPSLTSPPPITLYQSFLEQLRELGFFEGQNVIVDYRGFNDPRGPFVGTAELTRLQPNLMVISGPEVALQAVLGVSGFIPVVMIAADFDPIARGYITSLSQPGGNITGVVFQQLELAQKAHRAAGRDFSLPKTVSRSV